MVSASSKVWAGLMRLANKDAGGGIKRSDLREEVGDAPSDGTLSNVLSDAEDLGILERVEEGAKVWYFSGEFQQVGG